MNEIRFYKEGQNILLLCNGRYITEFSWRVGDELAKALSSMARQCEHSEPSVIHQAIQDQRVLNNAGIPLVLHSGKVFKESLKHTPLKGLESAEKVFKPKIIQGAPR